MPVVNQMAHKFPKSRTNDDDYDDIDDDCIEWALCGLIKCITLPIFYTLKFVFIKVPVWTYTKIKCSNNIEEAKIEYPSVNQKDKEESIQQPTFVLKEVKIVQ